MLYMLSFLQAPQLQATALQQTATLCNSPIKSSAPSKRVLCRDKEHSTIIYESPQPDTPLLRLGWNKQDPRYMATLLMDSSKVVVLDIRSGLRSSSMLHLDRRYNQPVKHSLQSSMTPQPLLSLALSSVSQVHQAIHMTASCTCQL